MASSRSRALVSWLPAVILLVVIAGVVFTTIAVQNSWWAQESPVASSDQKASDGSSTLSDAGLDYVNVEGVLRVRIGDGALPVTEIGLGADQEKPATFRRPVRTLVAVGDEVYVVDDVESMVALAQADRLMRLSLTVGQPVPWAEAVAKVQGFAGDFGWNQSEIASWEESLSEFTRDQTEGTFTTEVTSTDAAQVTGSLVFDRASAGTTLTITFAPVA